MANFIWTLCAMAELLWSGTRIEGNACLEKVN